MIDKENRSSYRNIFKATSLFGGVQVYQILMNVIKSKFLAILLGPYGIGFQGLFISATDLIKQFTSFGLSQSAVRDVSEANNSGDSTRVYRVVNVANKLVLITGLLGLILTVILSPILSKLTFGNYDFSISFVFLSVTLLFDQICSGQKVILQGLRRLKDLAKASAIGSTMGLIVSVPLYYLFGIKGIVPTLILNSATILFLTWLFSKKIDIPKVGVSYHQLKADGSQMLKLGLALCVSSILLSFSSFVLRSYIRQIDGTDSVGLFTAGYTIINTYVAMFFNAMGTDFYPRLSAINDDNNKCRKMINQQGEIGILMLGPLLILFLAFMPFMIKILYSDKFLLAHDYLLFACMGMLLKMTSWCISYQFIAKSESRIFVMNEIFQNVYTLLLNLVAYYMFGLKGLGISFVLCQLIYLLQVYIIAKKKYLFCFTCEFKKVFYSQSLLLVLFVVVIILLNRNIITYLIGGVLFSISLLLSLKGLNKRIGLKYTFQSLKKSK